MIEEDVAVAVGLSQSVHISNGTLGKLGSDTLQSAALGRRLSDRFGIELAGTISFDHPTSERLAEYLDAVIFGFDVGGDSVGIVDECLARITANLPALTSQSQLLMIREALETLVDQSRSL